MRILEASEREAARTAEQEAERDRRAADRSNPVLSGAALIAECESAVRIVLSRTGRKVSESERESLVQTVACDALTAHREQRGSAPLRRSDIGRTYLSALARGHLKQERGWRDTLDGFRTRAERAHGMVPLIAGSVEQSESEQSESESEQRGSWLSRSLARERERSAARPLPAIAPEHLRLIADALSEVLADECGCTDRERRNVRSAVESACGVPLIRQSERPGAPSIATIKRDAASGAALIRERLSVRMVAALARIVAESESEDAALRRALRTALSPEQERAALAASESVEAVLCAEYAYVRRAASEGGRATASAAPLSRLSGPQYRHREHRSTRAPEVCRVCFKCHPAGYPDGIHPVRSTVT